MCWRHAALMSISRSSAPEAAASRRALVRVRSVVPKPGQGRGENPRARQTQKVEGPRARPAGPGSSRARPRGPGPRGEGRVCSRRRARPAVWMEKISRQRSSRVARIAGHEGVRVDHAHQAMGAGRRDRSQARSGGRPGPGDRRHRRRSSAACARPRAAPCPRRRGRSGPRARTVRLRRGGRRSPRP